MPIPARWGIAAAIGWAGALLLYAASSHVSLVLLLGPIAFILGDAAAERRKARLQALVDAAFVQLTSEDGRFDGRTAAVLRQRSRLLGWPPRLIDIRIAQGLDGTHWAVRGEARGPSLDDIDWRVTPLTERRGAGRGGELIPCLRCSTNLTRYPPAS